MIHGQDDDDDADNDNDVDTYVNKMENIVARNLEIYSDMAKQLSRFKNLLKEEEMAAKTIQK